ncbi:MAG: helix-turn-helix domain-containing protein [Sphingopyxis sp.]|nr:helix-turn-helix domain-containing protein [Sphingopyxis sp.]
MSNPFGRPAEISSRPYLNTRQTAHYLALSVRKLEQMRAEGEGPRYRRHGRLVFYHVDDLEAWSLGTAGGGGDHG